MPKEILNIASSLLNINKNIEDLRSNKTKTHGKTDKEYIVDNPIYAYFVINYVSTVGLFLSSFYKNVFQSKAEDI